MPNRKTKPTSPGRRFAHLPDCASSSPAPSRSKKLTEGKTQVRRPQRQRPRHRAPPRRRRQAPLPPDRLQAHSRTGSPRRSRRSSTTRTAAATSPCSTTPTARRATSSPRRALAVGDEVAVRRRRRHPRPATRCRWREMPTGTVVHNVELIPGQGGKLGRAAGTAIQVVAKEGDMVTLRLPSSEMRHGPRRVPRDRRHALERRAPERQDRQGRPQPPQGQAPADAAASR